MTVNFGRSVLSVLVAATATVLNCEAGFARLQVQPFLCASQGSNVGWVNVQNQTAIGVTLRQTGDQGGGKFVDIELSKVKSNATVTLATIQNQQSANLSIRLGLKLSNGQVHFLSPTSRNGDTYTWNLAVYKLSPSATITHMAVFAQNTVNSLGSIFLTQFVINGAAKTDRINAAAGCLSY